MRRVLAIKQVTKKQQKVVFRGVKMATILNIFVILSKELPKIISSTSTMTLNKTKNNFRSF